MRRLVCVIGMMLGLAAGCSKGPEGRTRKTLTITGTVIERVDGPPYSYIRIRTDTGEVWAMVPIAGVGKNERVTIAEGVLLKDFDTGLPGRRFDVVMGALKQR